MRRHKSVEKILAEAEARRVSAGGDTPANPRLHNVADLERIAELEAELAVDVETMASMERNLNKTADQREEQRTRAEKAEAEVERLKHGYCPNCGMYVTLNSAWDNWDIKFLCTVCGGDTRRCKGVHAAAEPAARKEREDG